MPTVGPLPQAQRTFQVRIHVAGVMPGALFHAICNVGVVFLDYSYGLR